MPFGKEFDLITDHKALEILFGPRFKPCARIEHWVLRLQSYKFNVIYKPGKVNIADPLSSMGGDKHKHQLWNKQEACVLFLWQYTTS